MKTVRSLYNMDSKLSKLRCEVNVFALAKSASIFYAFSRKVY